LTAVWKQANSIPVDPVNPVTPVTPSIPVTPALPNHQHTVENKGYQTVQKISKQPAKKIKNKHKQLEKITQDRRNIEYSIANARGPVYNEWFGTFGR
ncbi:hypothetical protein PCORN_18896, partial [Listeria cornellensis FSL F6-0969]